MKENNTYHDGMEGLNLPESLRVTPFVTPDNYFEALSINLIARTSLEGKIPPEEIPFSVPNDYFSQLTDRIQSQAKITTYTDNTDAWETPTGYFENLADQIQTRIRVETIADQENDFSVPMGYFEQLSERIEARQFEDKLRTTISTDGFVAPDQYFSKLTAGITAKITQEDAAVVPTRGTTVVRKINIQSWVQYAAAACVATILGLTSYNAVVDHNAVDATQSHLAAVPDEEIINYLASSNTSDDMLYIMEYIVEPAKEEAVCSEVKDNDIEDYLNYML